MTVIIAQAVNSTLDNQTLISLYVKLEGTDISVILQPKSKDTNLFSKVDNLPIKILVFLAENGRRFGNGYVTYNIGV